MPPSTRNVVAVMKDESSLARKATAAAISSGAPKRPIGTWTSRRCARSASLAKRSRSSGVFTGPGHSALTRRPARTALHAAAARAARVIAASVASYVPDGAPVAFRRWVSDAEPGDREDRRVSPADRRMRVDREVACHTRRI